MDAGPIDGGVTNGPVSCPLVSTDRKPPYSVTFRLTNPGTTPVFVHQGCVGVSLSVPPIILSAPAPPFSVSLPPSPVRVLAPVLPDRTSLKEEPVRFSIEIR